MSATTVLIHLLGGVALLLWGLRMVRTGLERAYGARLRLVLGRSLRRPAAALAAGLGITLLLQSSTATCLITASLAGRGLVATGAALAVMLGADIGTSLVAQVLSLNLGLLWPFLLFGGVVAFQAGRRKRTRDLGRMAVGLGLLLLALTLIVTDVEPMRQSATVQIVLRSLAGEPALAVLVAALLTWLAHSSLAVILLTASLAAPCRPSWRR